MSFRILTDTQPHDPLCDAVHLLRLLHAYMRAVSVRDERHKQRAKQQDEQREHAHVKWMLSVGMCVIASVTAFVLGRSA